jgi:hypothetical protein
MKALENGHAPVNGINIYYEVHGCGGGIPLVLLHGGGSTIEVAFSRVLPVFASSRRVIAVEEQGHGRTSDRDAPVTFESSADDVAALLRYLKVERADISGFSNIPQLWKSMKQADFSNMPQPPAPGICHPSRHGIPERPHMTND